eukprot:CAMPEP_0172743552 /NCGR_PEP_ID=MMETSP1074-20121228/132552_1 /TAXON_ID=2916 /ORGANISM="Ceratium fusus, Strain PA161109" /LENGTH=67 /DNA_ID=CAMNT_0013574295 /DNA_START=161 /DNA_END=364 /DNA_ORIENTATION=-
MTWWTTESLYCSHKVVFGNTEVCLKANGQHNPAQECEQADSVAGPRYAAQPENQSNDQCPSLLGRNY